MNRNCYRLVFNKLRQAMMAVGEHARGTRPGMKVGRRRRPQAPPAGLPQAAGVALGLAAGLAFTSPAWAQIVADRNAPGKQQATVLTAPNGVVLVNIQAASQAGVSRNLYSQFDVPERGAILNNSNRDVQTQQGGWVQANPWLAAGTARVILNEVNAAKPSQLLGALEVAGSSAQVVVANAAGITCQGCGFINAAGVTLSTGKPLLNSASGALEGYRVQQGQITVDGAGFNSGSASFTDLIARAVQVNAGLWANRLQVAAGAQQINGGGGADLQTVQRLPDLASVPTVAIDVAQLGGMYAGQIRLIGTADGVGVRNAGQLYAGIGELVVTVDGRVENIGSMRAAGGMDLRAQAMDNSGSLQTDAGRDAVLSLQLNDTLANTGLITGDDTRLDAAIISNREGGRIYGDRVSLRADRVDNLGDAVAAPVIAARERLDIGAAQIENREHALLHSDGGLAIGGNLDAQRRASGQAQILNNASAAIEAGTDLELRADTVRNSNEHFSLTTENLPPQQIFEYQGAGSPKRYLPGTPGVYVYNDESDHLQTPEGSYESWSTYSYTRNVSETRVANSDPARITAGRDMRITANSLVNDNSQIVASRNLDAPVDRLENIETPGQRVTSDRGVVNNYWRNHKKGRDETGWNQVAYEPPDLVESIAVSPMLFRQNGQSQGGPSAQVPIFETDANGGLVRSGGIDLRIPTSSLFRQVPEGHYLIETDPLFANHRTWLGSDYLLSSLSVSPEAMQKRLGDGYYERKLVREQVAQLTGRRFLENSSSDEAQYQALMDNAITFAQAHQLVPGIALSAQQMAQLTSDIVWLVDKEIVLPDGSTTHALVPQLYVRVREGDLLAGGALLAADSLKFDLGTLENQGSIAGRKLLQVQASQTLRNAGGRMQGDTVALEARANIENLGGSMRAGRSLELNAGGDLVAASTTRTQSNTQGSVTNIDRMATLYVSGSAGSMSLKAGRDVRLDAAAVASEGEIALTAARDINLGTVQQASSHNIAWSADNRRSDASTSEAGTVMLAQGSLSMQAGRDLQARSATAISNEGAVNLKAGQDLRIVAGTDTQMVDELHVHKGTSGILSSTTYTEHDQLAESSARGSTIAARSVELEAGRNMQVQGSTLAAEGDVRLAAGNDIAVDAAGQSRKETRLRKEETTGVFSSGGIGISIGSQDQTLEQRGEAITSAASSIVSQGGDIGIRAGQNYGQKGSDVSAVQGSVDIQARSVEIREARHTSRSTVERSFEQSGLTVAVTSPVLTAIQTVEQMKDAATDSQDSRVKALAVANGVMAIKSGIDAVIAGQGSTVDSRPNQIATGNKTADGQHETRDATVADKVGGINLALSLGSSSSRSTAVIDSDIGRASGVSAGQNVTLRATGAGSASKLIVQGSELKAGGTAVLQADGAIQLQAGRDTATQQSNSSDRSASLGVSVGTDGLLVTASMSAGHGKADGSDVVHNNARVAAGEKAVLQSGGDTSLQGAVIAAPRVEAQVGGELQVQSLGDSSQYKSKQQSLGASIAIGAGRVSGNIAASRGNIESDYASVAEQSGIKAGDGGFDVSVKGKAVLDGAVISSTQAAVEGGRNRYEAQGETVLTDIANQASYEANSTSVNFGTSVDPSGKLARLGTGAGLGQDGDQAGSVSQAGISGIAGNQSVRTGDEQQPLKRIFDLDRVQREVNAQVKVTQAFTAQASREIASYVDAQRAQIQTRRNSAKSESERKTLDKELDELRLQEAALNILVGAIAGQPGAAVSKESLAIAAEKMRAFTTEDSSKFPGVVDGEGKEKTVLSNSTGASAGVRGDGKKDAGTRVDLDLLCGLNNERCKVERDKNNEPILDEQGKTILVLDDQGMVMWDREKANMSLATFLLTDGGKKMIGPTGGVQGAKGTLFGYEYPSGGSLDKLLEAFAGPHDYLGGTASGLYDESGNIKRGMSNLERKTYDTYSAVAIPVAAPFALADFLSPEVWGALSALVQAAR